MAKAILKTSLSFTAKITLELDESEAKALNEMTKYGVKAFLDGYKAQLGKHYIEPHEAGMTSLFETIDKSLPVELKKLDECKQAIESASMGRPI